MADIFSKKERSRIMAAIRSKDTRPELVVRRMVHAMSFRYRLHVRSIMGTPDLVFVGRRKIINVHGCFWHCHTCRRGRSEPKSNREFWQRKRSRNRRRDRQVRASLRRDGWSVMEIWECQTSDREKMLTQIRDFLLDDSMRESATIRVLDRDTATC